MLDSGKYSYILRHGVVVESSQTKRDSPDNGKAYNMKTIRYKNLVDQEQLNTDLVDYLLLKQELLK